MAKSLANRFIPSQNIDLVLSQPVVFDLGEGGALLPRIPEQSRRLVVRGG